MTTRKIYRVRVEVINRERERRGWDLHTLALAAKVDAKTITNAMSRRPVSLTTVRKLARALKMECDEVLEGRRAPLAQRKPVEPLVCELSFKFYGNPETFKKRHLAPFIKHLREFIGDDDFPTDGIRKGSVIVDARSAPLTATIVAARFLSRDLQSIGVISLEISGPLDLPWAIRLGCDYMRRNSRRPTRGTRPLFHVAITRIERLADKAVYSKPGETLQFRHPDGTIIKVRCMTSQKWRFTEKRTSSDSSDAELSAGTTNRGSRTR